VFDFIIDHYALMYINDHSNAKCAVVENADMMLLIQRSIMPFCLPNNA